MITRLARRLNDGLRHVGVRVCRYPSPADRRRMRLMEIRRIGTVIDVGANTGQYALHLRQLGYRGRIHSFEPLPDAFAALEARAKSDPNWQVSRLAVGDSPGTVRLNVAANSYSSSILAIEKRHLDADPASATVSNVEAQSTTLDEILSETDEVPIMVKIDTQGYEGRVLAGGRASLHKVQLLEIELCLFELYAGQPLFRELDAQLTSLGFELASLEEGFFDARSGELLAVDAIYARRTVAMF